MKLKIILHQKDSNKETPNSLLHKTRINNYKKIKYDV